MSQAQIVKLSTTGKWEGGVKTSTYVRNFPVMVMDEPTQLGGTDEGANPMEYVLAALSGCTSVMISLIAQEINFAFRDVEFSNTGYLDLRGLMGVDGVSPHFSKINFQVAILTEESEERLEQLKLLVEKRCPVYNLLRDAKVQIQAEWVCKAVTTKTV